MNREKEIRDITLWGSVINIVLTVGKVMAGIIGQSAAMIADGIHSLSDLLSDIVVLIFTHISSKGKDRDQVLQSCLRPYYLKTDTTYYCLYILLLFDSSLIFLMQ